MKTGKYPIVTAAALAMMISCGNGRRAATASEAEATAAHSPVQYSYEVIAEYPHDRGSYTQGLYWADGYLWEGTGEYGRSALQQVDLESGRILRKVELEGRYFGEGIALLNGNIYQLTWTDGVGFVYDAATFERTGTFRYSGEGWGLTTDGEKLYMSNGSHEIAVIDPDGFRQTGTIIVTEGRRRQRLLNELEWIDGKIWANVYLTDRIVIIDPATGIIEGTVDLTGLLPRSEIRHDTDVLNGIAYDAQNDHIFVTGKKWSRLYHIKLKKQ